MSAPETLKSHAEVSEPVTPAALSLEQFLEELEAFAESIPISSLQVLLSRLETDERDIAPFVRFGKENYQRNLVTRNDNFEVLVLCFEAGQRTPIHDHAGSACGVKILEGTATETVFTTSSGGWLYATGSADLAAEGVVGSVDMDVHQLSNLQAGEKRLVTLHIYSPPLGEVGNYSITDNSVTTVKAATKR